SLCDPTAIGMVAYTGPSSALGKEDNLIFCALSIRVKLSYFVNQESPRLLWRLKIRIPPMDAGLQPDNSWKLCPRRHRSGPQFWRAFCATPLENQPFPTFEGLVHR